MANINKLLIFVSGYCNDIMKLRKHITVLFCLLPFIQISGIVASDRKSDILIKSRIINGISNDSNVHLKDFVRSNLDNFKIYPWFEYAYRDYVPDAQKVDSLVLLKDHISIIVFGGSWCGDTHELLPKFYKAVEIAKIAPSRITLVGVDRRKHSHDGRCWKYRIKRVPTFVLFYDGKEIGRVVESVQINIESDILNQYHKAGY